MNTAQNSNAAPGRTLAQVRAGSSYPQLRQLIALVQWAGIIAGGVVVLFEGTRGLHAGDVGSLAIAFGVFCLTGFWSVVFKSAASLVVDIADLLIEIVEQLRR